MAYPQAEDVRPDQPVRIEIERVGGKFKWSCPGEGSSSDARFGSADDAVADAKSVYFDRSFDVEVLS